jgi:polyphosphate kinase 2
LRKKTLRPCCGGSRRWREARAGSGEWEQALGFGGAVVAGSEGKAKRPAKDKAAGRDKAAAHDRATPDGLTAHDGLTAQDRTTAPPGPRGQDGAQARHGAPAHFGLAGRPDAETRDPAGPLEPVPKKAYRTELYRLQAELVKLQEWVRVERARIVVIFEGRDAAGKGSTIKRVAEFLNPRIARIVALPAPTEREQTEWYFQRYVQHLPAGGQIVLFDRSWYNRAGVERVMGFCSKEEYGRFLHQCPIFERLLVEDGILLRKYWFSVSDEEQENRFRSRLEDPMRRWKLSPMDLESISQWENYSRAKDEMFVHTDIPEAPWFVVDSDDKRRARINMIAHLLSSVPYHDVQRLPLSLPPRPRSQGYVRAPRELQTYVADHAASFERHHHK